MKLRTLFLLLAVVASSLTAYFYMSENERKNAPSSLALIPALQGNLNSVTKFTVTEAGDALRSSVSKTEAGWVVDNRDGYEANVAVIRDAFEKLAEARLTEAKTSSPDKYSRLGVEGVENANAQGVLLTVEGLQDEVNIIFGNAGSSGENTQYVRHQNEQQSWLINRRVEIAKAPTDWLKKEILDIPPERIKAIAIEHADGSVVNIVNTGNGEAYQFELDIATPEGKKVSDTELYQVANALSSLHLKDVSQLKWSDAEDEVPSVSTTFKTYDGLTVTTRAYPSTAESNFMIEVAFNAEDVDEERAKGTGNTEGAMIVFDPVVAEALANKLEPKLAGWAYVFPTITQTALTKKLEDFFVAEDA